MSLSWQKLLNSDSILPRSTEVAATDKRSPFDSDRDRIIFSTPFRRLQDKAQLFPLENSDFIRTRLTHSLEVAAIAKSIGVSVATEISENLSDLYNWNDDYLHDIPVILECAGLVHDLGNPPFGHIAEKYIEQTIEEFNNNFFKNIFSKKKLFNDFSKFDGNVQTFRILTHLQCIKDLYGYHLTKACLATIMKYPVNSVSGNKKNNKANDDIRLHKFGFFYSERKEAEDVLKSCGLKKGVRHPLTFLLEAADDIAYSAGDIEDGAKKGLLNLGIILKFFTDFNAAKNDCLVNEIINEIKKIENDYDYITDEKKIQRLRIVIQGKLIDKTVLAFKNNYDDIMQGEYKNDIIFDSEGKELKSLLKQMSKKYLMDSYEVLLKESSGKAIVNFLMRYFIEGLFGKGKQNICKILKENNGSYIFDDEVVDTHVTSLISEDYKEIYFLTLKNNKIKLTDKENIAYYTLRLITDYISGMTDNYCLELYRKLNGFSV